MGVSPFTILRILTYSSRSFSFAAIPFGEQSKEARFPSARQSAIASAPYRFSNNLSADSIASWTLGWYSTTKNGILKPVEINYDYWDEDNGGKGFDFTSSYLLAVIKYAKPICDYISELKKTPLENYPQDFWAKLRGVNGELRNAKYFLDNYFKSGVHMIPEYLTSLNYKVKYLYKCALNSYIVTNNKHCILYFVV